MLNQAKRFSRITDRLQLVDVAASAPYGDPSALLHSRRIGSIVQILLDQGFAVVTTRRELLETERHSTDHRRSEQ